MAGERGPGSTIEQPKTRAEKKAERLAINQPKNVEKHAAEKAAKALKLEAAKQVDQVDSAAQAQEIRVDLGIAEEPAEVVVVTQEAPAQAPPTKAERNRAFADAKKARKNAYRNNEGPQPKDWVQSLQEQYRGAVDSSAVINNGLEIPAAPDVPAEVVSEAPAEQPKEATVESKLHRPERNAPGSSNTAEGSMTSVPGMDAGELGRAMAASRAREAAGENLDVQDVKADAKPSMWAKVKGWFRSSASSGEAVSQGAERAVSANNAEQNALAAKMATEGFFDQSTEDMYGDGASGFVRESERHTGGSANTAGVESTPFSSRAEINARGDAMRETQKLEDAANKGVKTESEWWNQSGADQLAAAMTAMNEEMQTPDAVKSFLLSKEVPKRIVEKYKTPEDLLQFVKEPGFWATLTGADKTTKDALTELVTTMNSKATKAGSNSLAGQSRGEGFASIGKLPGAEKAKSTSQEKDYKTRTAEEAERALLETYGDRANTDEDKKAA